MEESVWKARRASRVEQRDAHFMHEKDHAGDNGACIRTCDNWCVFGVNPLFMMQRSAIPTRFLSRRVLLPAQLHAVLELATSVGD